MFLKTKRDFLHAKPAVKFHKSLKKTILINKIVQCQSFNVIELWLNVHWQNGQEDSWTKFCLINSTWSLDCHHRNRMTCTFCKGYNWLKWFLLHSSASSQGKLSDQSAAAKLLTGTPGLNIRYPCVSQRTYRLSHVVQICTSRANARDVNILFGYCRLCDP